MEYFLSFLILALNLYNYEKKLNVAIMFFAGLFIVALLFYVVYQKTRNFIATCFILMVYTWQISWINIFGNPTSELQLPWFYIFGLLIVLYGVFHIKDCYFKGYGSVPTVLFSIFFIIFLYPLIISQSFIAGMREFAVIGFFAAVVFISYLFRDTVGKEVHEHFKKALIWAVFLSSTLIIIQSMIYSYAGIGLFKFAVRRSFTGYQTSFYLLMEDHSSSSIMLGCAVFYIIDRLNKKNWLYFLPMLGIIFVSVAVTSRRSSTISLIIIIAAFVIFHYRNVAKKILFTIILGMGSLIMMYYLLIVRPVSEFSQILSDNGRFEGYIAALGIITKNPFGIGYDDDYLSSLMPYGVSPHNTILRWAAMGGIVFAVVLTAIIIYCIRAAFKKKLSAEFWAIVYSFFAANFIPDLLTARFFVLICSMAFLAREQSSMPEIPEEFYAPEYIPPEGDEPPYEELQI